VTSTGLKLGLPDDATVEDISSDGYGWENIFRLSLTALGREPPLN
jgi:hypothetical protein